MTTATEAGLDDNFYWGAATAAYQVEGSPLADGSGRCIWHEFAHTPGTIFQGQTGDVAADHYHRWREDIGLMREMGLNAYRFSIRWPRVLPEGEGKVNAPGLDFYNKLVDGLLDAGIEPFVTLYHWDLPSTLFRRGGWSNPDVGDWFAEYASLIAVALGDRVKRWVTLNEPYVVSAEGHLVGAHAPGMRNIYQTGCSVHNQLRAHVSAYRAIKAARPGASVGLAVHNTAAWPASESAEDEAAAERAEAWHNFPLWLGPLVHGRYPEVLEGYLTPFLPEGYEQDMDALCVPPDFVGLNYYRGYRVRHSDSNWLGFEELDEPGVPKTAMDWAIRPDGLHRVITKAHEQYKLPSIYITENGAAFEDTLVGGSVRDLDRQGYLRSHVAAVLRARDEGAPVQGYFVWSLLDNFEWAYGYSQRFGLIYVDYATQERTIKHSGRWYGQLARTGVLPAN